MAQSTQSSSLFVLPEARGVLLDVKLNECGDGEIESSQGEGGNDDLETALLCFLQTGETSFDRAELSSKEELTLAALQWT